MTMLEIQNVRVVYEGGNEALKTVSLKAERGEIISVIGRSGAGKSTLLRTINGLQTVTSGQIILDGENITNMRGQALRHARRYIGFIWQEHHLIERLSAMTNVLTGRLAYASEPLTWFHYFDRQQRQIALRNLERVNLLHRANFRADRLSGGEKQRVSIARAISQQPKILLADEPVASLDPELAWQVMGDLARVAREDGVLTLINLHQVELAKTFSDRIIGIAQGEVEFDGKPSELTPAILDRIYRFDQPVAHVSHAPAVSFEIATA
ncbi:MAG: phosphonate ABC transporter ATP-binding protein [Phototrophicaceae bacterium]|jgi:phosphonate transport system ATP-binding protein